MSFDRLAQLIGERRPRLAALVEHPSALHLGHNESYPDVFPPFQGFVNRIRGGDGDVGIPDTPGVPRVRSARGMRNATCTAYTTAVQTCT